jgi:DNA-binding NtrC family response regulator
LILAGAHAGDPEASEFLVSVQRHQPHVPLILLLSGEAPDLANQALRFGASSVLRFPSPTTQVRAAVLHALSRQVGSSAHVGQAPSRVASHATPRSVEAAMLGDDPALRQALELGRAVAPTRSPVLIVGGAGTGKSLLARIIHELSPRRNGPFVEVACGPQGGRALEQTLFGGWCDDSSSCAGAESDRGGLVARAHGGTLVLDDVNALPPALQLKLHMVLHDGRIETLRATRVVRVDVRLILTGSGSVLSEAMLGRYWQHVYAHGSTAMLRLPPLCERGTDVVRLAEHFLGRAAVESGRATPVLAPEAIASLARYRWPGNVTELKSVMKKALANAPGMRIEPAHLGLTAGEKLAVAAVSRARRRAADAAAGAARARIIPLRDALAEPEKWIILRALQACGWNRQETSDALVINRATLDKKMKKYGLFTGTPNLVDKGGAGADVSSA